MRTDFATRLLSGALPREIGNPFRLPEIKAIDLFSGLIFLAPKNSNCDSFRLPTSVLEINVVQTFGVTFKLLHANVGHRVFDELIQ